MEAACGISWPADRLIIQVLDDSTNEVLRELVEMECHKWMEKGENINCKTRNNRNGYKAGALKEGLEKQYVKTEFVAIFDAYFQPEEDFLWRTIPYLLENPDIGLVQARWKFWKIVAHWVTFFFYCIVIPTIVVPEVQISKPLAVYTPASITILNAVSTSRSLNLVVFWILFENVMSIHLSKATIIGLLQANWVDEWAATEKLGNTVKPKSNLVNHVLRKPRPQTSRRIHVLELLMGMFMLRCAVYNLLYKKDHFFFYLLLQAGDFFIMALGYVGTFVPN
uniref:Glycosyltransferase 2-like domain-containing protein n=1 Tax=Cannabis sativa TaxID=3483 RepID=A0A803P5A8_CANSA